METVNRRPDNKEYSGSCRGVLLFPLCECRSGTPSSPVTTLKTTRNRCQTVDLATGGFSNERGHLGCADNPLPARVSQSAARRTGGRSWLAAFVRGRIHAEAPSSLHLHFPLPLLVFILLLGQESCGHLGKTPASNNVHILFVKCWT